MEARATSKLDLVQLSAQDRANIASTPLHLAVLQNNVEMVKAIFESGARLSQKNKKGQSAFELACELGYYDCAEQFETYFTDYVDHSGGKYGRLFLYAIANHDIELAQKLHQAGASTLAVTRDKGYTALHIAANSFSSKSGNTIEFLVGIGASLTATDRFGRNPIVSVCNEKYHWDNAAKLISLINKELMSADEFAKLDLDSALISAIREKNLVTVKLLLEKGANANSRRDSRILGNTAIWHAIYYCDDTPEILQTLLAHGADPNMRKNEGKNCYEIALELQKPKSAAMLLPYISGVSPETMKGFTTEISQHFNKITSPDAKPFDTLLDTILYFAMIHDLFAHDIKSLQAKRNTLCLNRAAHEQEIDLLDKQIVSLLRVQQYPDKIKGVDECLQNTEAGTHIAEHCKRLELINEYSARVKTHLLQLESRINERQWYIKSFFETFTNKFHQGTPKHIAMLKTELNRLKNDSSIVETLGVYVNISRILHGIKPDRNRHGLTTLFYQEELNRVNNLHFIPANDVEVARVTQ